MIQLELYLVTNANKTKVDDDWVWEIANSIRWLSQNYKEKFKIEKFIFGEIYETYNPLLSDLFQSLKEELGYDNDENTDTDDNAQSSSLCSSAPTSPTSSPLATPVKPSPLKNGQSSLVSSIVTNSSSQHISSTTKNDTSLTFTGGINSLFEDFTSQSQSVFNQGSSINASSIFNDSNENDDNNNTTLTNTHATNENNSDDLLDEFKKKKTYFYF